MQPRSQAQLLYGGGIAYLPGQMGGKEVVSHGRTQTVSAQGRHNGDEPVNDRREAIPSCA